MSARSVQEKSLREVFAKASNRIGDQRARTTRILHGTRKSRLAIRETDERRSCMKWAADADEAVSNVPFFVRKKVRNRVEKEVAAAGRDTVSLADVNRARARFLKNMSAEVRGYQLDTCFGAGGCPNVAFPSGDMLEKIRDVLETADLLTFLKRNVRGPLKYHHEFRVSLAECPNGCSQPQIKDIGILAAVVPAVTDEPCSACHACVEVCPDRCVFLLQKGRPPEIDRRRCMRCARCITACPTGTLANGGQGYRIQLGGKLGRHPQLARELPGIYSEEGVLAVLQWCLDRYKRPGTAGRRFAELFGEKEFAKLTGWIDRQSWRPLPEVSDT
jgi:anaerobic sulfite reductase subunit C